MPAELLRNGPLRRAVLVLTATAVLVMIARLVWPLDPGQTFAGPQPKPTAGAPQTYAAALARVDQDLAAGRELAKTRGGEWLVQDGIAKAALAGARLTGSFDDYAVAQAALDRAFETAPKGAGPHLTRAVLDFSLHRLARAEASLDAIDGYAVKAEPEIGGEAWAMRGDLAFYRGDYAQALAHYQRKDAPDDAGGAFRLAVYQGKTGQIDAALAAIDKMARTARFPSAQFLANLDLQRGGLELQRGNWDQAAKAFARADAVFPGYWLAQAHRAQMLALAGKRAEAVAQFLAIAGRNPSPEVMDALAGLYRAQGDAANSRLWADRAGAAWERRLVQFPEAAYGHAVEHYLAFGEPARALDLAQRDYAARPYGGAAVALAWAWLANNRPAEALRAVEPALASAWVSSDQHIVAAQAHALLDDSDAADAEQQKALAINPRALDRNAALIWFGH